MTIGLSNAPPRPVSSARRSNFSSASGRLRPAHHLFHCNPPRAVKQPVDLARSRRRPANTNGGRQNAAPLFTMPAPGATLHSRTRPGQCPICPIARQGNTRRSTAVFGDCRSLPLPRRGSCGIFTRTRAWHQLSHAHSGLQQPGSGQGIEAQGQQHRIKEVDHESVFGGSRAGSCII